MSDRLRNARLLAVAALGLVLFNYPFLVLFARDQFVGGVPLLWAFLFAAWALLIALVAWIVRR